MMDFKTYRSKVNVFARVFTVLHFIPGILDNAQSDRIKEVKDIYSQTLREWMDDAPGSLDEGYDVHTPLPLDCLKSIDNVNLSATEDDLCRQAELVKQEIIELGKLMRKLSRAIKPVNPEKRIPPSFLLTDYIRDPDGEIVEPFEYWRDCVEVYLLRHLNGKSNASIATAYTLRSSGSKTMRARQALIAGMLNETEKLMSVVMSDRFPPTTLSGTKQPTMIS